MDNILAHIKNPDQPHVVAVHLVFENLWKYGLYINLKKCRFYQNEVRFLRFIVSAWGIKLKEEKIEAVKA